MIDKIDFFPSLKNIIYWFFGLIGGLLSIYSHVIVFIDLFLSLNNIIYWFFSPNIGLGLICSHVIVIIDFFLSPKNITYWFFSPNIGLGLIYSHVIVFIDFKHAKKHYLSIYWLIQQLSQKIAFIKHVLISKENLSVMKLFQLAISLICTCFYIFKYSHRTFYWFLYFMLFYLQAPVLKFIFQIKKNH